MMGNIRRGGDVFRRSVKLTGAQKDDAGNVGMELFFYDVLEESSVDEEGLSVVDGSISSDLLCSILVF